ncbi:MAG: SDR family NAD(P)-dependent oxidoreductase [Myxococcales bacterium]|nr:SDR family NAD(P)-dependent oxidoreductase [Myxococcales bacterium]
MSESAEDNDNDIAIVGISLRVPGAHTTGEFWSNLRDGVESISRFTDEDLLAAGETPEKLRNPAYVRAGGVLDGMESFDGEFFGFSPKECAILDPQHRHFTECCWEALEDAGHVPDSFEGQIGLFAGCGMGSYFYFNVCTNRELLDTVGMFLLRHTGNDKDFLSTRVSYLLDLKGPSVNVQTACSTSLVAVHLACQSLLTGECDMALAGGVTIEFPHRLGYLYREGEVLSPAGPCPACARRAGGPVFGSGAGVVTLRRLEDAIADGDHIYSVIRGSAVNNDGARKVGYLAPSVDGQASAMTEAHEVACVDPATITYIECHGTGTYMGDPIEISALTQAFRQQTEDTGFCRIGSVKTNIGHLDTAAGVVSLIKASLALQHKQIPPSLNFEKPNPTIDFERTPFVVNDALSDWSDERGPRRAGINSLGVGGTNAHVVVEEAPERPAADTTEHHHELLLLSARNNSALDGNSQRLAAFLRDNPDVNLADVAHTLRVGRKAFDRRRVVAVRDVEEAIEVLEANDPRRVFNHTPVEGDASVAFMFSGGGSQYPRMAADLYERYPVFKEHLDRGLVALQERTGYDFRQLFFAPEDELEEAAIEFEKTPRQLPGIFIVEYALAQLWRSWGIEPEVMIGHSVGENTAACLAGVIGFDDCLGLVILRGELVEKAPAGAMLSVQLPPEALEKHLEGDVDLATVNGPELCVASGSVEAVDALEQKLAEAEVEMRRLPIPVAGHSRMLDPILGEFRTYLQGVELSPPQLPFISNRTGQPITDEQAQSPDYWVEHLRHTVRFADGIDTLMQTPGRVLIEIGPGQTLCSLARQHPGARAGAQVFPTLRHKDDTIADDAFFLSSLGRAWASGVEIDLGRLHEGENRQRLSLPTYAFSHRPYFIEPTKLAQVGEDLENLARIEDVTDWGSRPVWIQRPPEPATREQPGAWLVFMDDVGIGKRLVQRLKDRDLDVVQVFEGDTYLKRSDHEYVISPERGRTGYDALVRDLVASGRALGHIVHLWLVTREERFRPGSSFFHRNLEDGFHSLLFLAQALGEENVPRPLQLSVISTGMQRVAEEALPYPEKAAVLGPVRVIPREFTGVTCRSIDVELPQRSLPTLGSIVEAIRRPVRGAGAVLDEIGGQLESELLSAGDDSVVALRGGARYVQRYEPQTLAELSEPGAGLRQGGTYLITGGLGGLGLNLAEHLAKAARANLVLIGRTSLPERAEWDRWLTARGPEDVTSRKMLQIRAIEEAGGEVLTAAADVTNLEQMRDVLQRARDRFGSVHGVFHTAGVVRDELIQLKLESDVEDVFAPKVHGTLVLDALFEDSDLELMVLFSSTSAITGPTGQVDYVAANAFLDAYAQGKAGDSQRRTLAVNWGIWHQVGMAAEGFGRQDGVAASEPVTSHNGHPLLTSRLQDTRGRTALSTEYDTKKLWVLDEHRTGGGDALLPGTGYLELAYAAAREHGEQGPVELQDLFFIRPLHVLDGTPKEVRVMLRRTEAGYGFEVRSACELEGQPGWELHAQGSMELGAMARPQDVNLEGIRARCERREEAPAGEVLRSGQEEHLRFGPRWQVMREVAYGNGEALARMELSDAFVADTEQYLLHPALLDYATGYGMPLIEGYQPDALWVPLSYARVRIFDRLPAKIYSWVRNHGQNRKEDAFASFDITLTDEDGKVLMEVTEFTIKRLTDAPDFAQAQKPSRSEVELELTPGAGGERELSPAERRLRNNYERGILPEEGTDALDRVLAGPQLPQVVISSLDLESLVKQAGSSGDEAAEGGTKFDRPELDSEYVEPRDDLERTLVAFWEELLGVDKVGVQDSFFDLGGHSLIAVRLFAKIKKTYQAEFPISVLFEAPTIEGCANLIREVIGDAASAETPASGEAAAEAPRTPTAHKSRYKHLVAMHAGEGGDSTPFFLVAGMFGNVLNLRHLAHLVGSDRPFYGLQARGLFGDEPPHETFEEMAAAYIEEIRTVQPHGPYLIGGFSGGGLTAFEMAHQLRDAGEELGLLLLLDSRLPQTPSLTPLDRGKIQLQRLQRRGPAYVTEWARNRVKWELEQMQSRLGIEEEGSAPDQFHNQEVEAAFRAALPRYQMRHYPGTLVLFRPKLDNTYVLGPDRVLDAEKEWVWHDNGFGQYADAIQIYEMPGDHDSMVLEPNVRVMAERLRKCIDEADAGRSREAAAAES